MVDFSREISHDIRASTPDWTPCVEHQAPDGAPNVLFIAWDDMGFGSWDLLDVARLALRPGNGDGWQWC